MPIARFLTVARCPKCNRKHGWFPWETAFWQKKLSEQSGPIDGGPVYEVHLICKRCKQVEKQGREGPQE